MLQRQIVNVNKNELNLFLGQKDHLININNEKRLEKYVDSRFSIGRRGKRSV